MGEQHHDSKVAITQNLHVKEDVPLDHLSDLQLSGSG